MFNLIERIKNIMGKIIDEKAAIEEIKNKTTNNAINNKENKMENTKATIEVNVGELEVLNEKINYIANKLDELHSLSKDMELRALIESIEYITCGLISRDLKELKSKIR